MSGITLVQSRPPSSSSLDQIRELIKKQVSAVQVEDLLAILSDKQWIHNTERQRALLQDNDTLLQLVNAPDPFLRFVVFRLLRTLLLMNSGSPLLPWQENGLGVYQHQTALVELLFQRLFDEPQGQHGQQQEEDSSSPQRAIVDLFHELLKHHRHLVRKLGGAKDAHSNTDHHPAVVIVNKMTSPAFWALIVTRLLRTNETQYSTLILMIDIEKARSMEQRADTFIQDVQSCHLSIVRSVDQLLDTSPFLPSALRKLFELLSLLLQPGTPAAPGSGLAITPDLDATISLPIHIATSLSPLALQVIVALKDSDRNLDDFSTGATPFILTNNIAYSSIGEDLQPLVSTPEAMRQFGRVFLTAALSVLDILAVIADTSQATTQQDQGCDSNIGPSLIRLAFLLPKLLSFAQTWIGPSTLRLLLTIYGEDDAAVSWLLITLSQIQQRLEDDSLKLNLRRRHQFSKTAASSELLDALDVIDGHVQALKTCLLQHVHPLEALFLFLETIGYDDQTLLDLLLTLDDQNTGGMLAAVMMVLRSFTERDHQPLIDRWRQAIDTEEMDDGTDDSDSDFIDDEDGAAPGSGTRTRLFSVEFCIAQLSKQIRRLHERGLFPYNPRALLVVLDRTQDILSSIITDRIQSD